MIEPGPYRHFKGGQYEVVGTARHSETEESLVVYRSADGSMWVRPEATWSEIVEHEGRAVPRFTTEAD